MSTTDYLINTNILIYHTKGSRKTVNFVSKLIAEGAFHISILTEIEFLGWDKHTPSFSFFTILFRREKWKTY